MTATYFVADVFDGLATIKTNSVDLILSSPPFLALRSYLPTDHADKHREIGTETAPADYLDRLLDVIEACDRVLAPHGSLVIELGDTYAGTAPAMQSRIRDVDNYRPKISPLDKSLCLIPGIFAASLAYGRNLLRPERQTALWRIRNVIAWCRPNPPIGALSDKVRPATSYLTVATKTRDRYFDLDAVRRPNPRNDFAQNEAGAAPPLDFWIISPSGYAGSHYAVFPEELCRIPILSMCPQRVCLVCGQPARRITEKAGEHGAWRKTDERSSWMDSGNGRRLKTPSGPSGFTAEYETVGWTDCGHGQWRRGVTLDPFAGTGTVLAVAEGHGRDSIGIDIDERNADLARQRCGMFLTTETPSMIEVVL